MVLVIYEGYVWQHNLSKVDEDAWKLLEEGALTIFKFEDGKFFEACQDRTWKEVKHS